MYSILGKLGKGKAGAVFQLAILPGVKQTDNYQKRVRD